MKARRSKTSESQVFPARKRILPSASKPSSKISNFEVYLLILRLLRDHPRTEHALGVSLSELEKTNNGGHKGRVAEILQEMVTGRYLLVIQYTAGEERGNAYTLTKDGQDLIGGSIAVKSHVR